MKPHRTVIEVEVLHLGPYDPDSLEEVHRDITDGDCSGRWAIKSTEEVTPERMRDLLISQGSDPNFLDLGHEEDEEDDASD